MCKKGSYRHGDSITSITVTKTTEFLQLLKLKELPYIQVLFTRHSVSLSLGTTVFATSSNCTMGCLLAPNKRPIMNYLRSILHMRRALWTSDGRPAGPPAHTIKKSDACFILQLYCSRGVIIIAACYIPVAETYYGW